MALIKSLENQGNFLFRYRGQIPLFLFALAIPFIFITDYSLYSMNFLSFCILLGVFISILGFLIRFYTIGTTPRGTSGRNTREQVALQLNTTGIYSLLRHPLYLGNFLIWLGISITTINIFFIIIMSLLFWIYYERIMIAEESFLNMRFGKKYVEWSSYVPAFIPSFSFFRKTNVNFSFTSVLRREYSSFLACVIGFVYIDFLKNYVTKEIFTINKLSFIILISTCIIVFILRSLKHYSSLLNEDDRS